MLIDGRGVSLWRIRNIRHREGLRGFSSLVILFLIAVSAFGVVLLFPWFAAAKAQIEPLELFPGQAALSVRENVAYSKDLALDRLPADAQINPENMQPITHASIQFGEVGDTITAVLPVVNAGGERGQWVMTTGRGALSLFRLYIDRGDGLELLIDNRQSEQVREVLFQYQAFATEFSLEPGQEAMFVIQFQDTASSYMPLQVLTTTDFYADRRSNVALVSAVVAGSLILIFFNVLMFAITGKREFAWLGSAEIAFALNTLHAEGYTTIFLFYDAPGWQAYLGDMLRVSFSALMAQFGRVFLESDRRFPRLDMVLRAAVWSGWIIFVIALAAAILPGFDSALIHPIGWLHTAAVAVLLPVLAVLAIRHISTIYWPLILSWASVGAYIVYMAIGVSGVAPQLPLPWHWVGPVGLFECVMATLALCLHLRQLHFERVASEAKAKDALLEKLALSNEAARLAEERAGALAAVQSRDRLIEASGHDTRHVLHALNSAIHFTRKSDTKSLANDDLASLIEASARHLDEIVATTAGAGGQTSPFMAIGLVSPQRIFEDIQSIYQVPALEANVRLGWNVDSDCQLITDEAMLARAISNLVNNAIKFSNGGEVRLDCSADGSGFVLTVSDDGPGMPEDVFQELRGPAQGQEHTRLGTGWRAIREVMKLLDGTYLIENGRDGCSVTLRIPDPLAGETPERMTFAELEKQAAGMTMFDGEGASEGELEQMVAELDADAVPVLVQSDITSEKRMWAAKNFAMLLSTPLCRQVLNHPHVCRIHKMPADLARATS